MKQKEEYWAEAFADLGVDADYVEVGLLALERAIADHDKFVEKQLDVVNSLIESSNKMKETLHAIMRMEGHPDQTPS